ncbi:PIG-L family deacetylase [Bacillus sp. FJAT-49711]|uniref:PIG-L deacetylase family protein n=1 Tax=Bacillus sp. FJAT-49711 TaxID=2833585 RepID=UPI001BCA13D0|nr:PIG-L family deacetylase [Bacillus sp. FJAT-49711]MBS4220174.1 PIG-L family deacetylase [Bacillus sp. FJAT-49711]
MHIIKKLKKWIVIKLIEYIHKYDSRIKVVEYVRGLYRYPDKMLGRRFPSNWANGTDVLVFAAHPDDDVLGLGTILYRHSKNDDNIKVIFVTDGSGREGKSWHKRKNESISIAKRRYKEAVKALSLINIPDENIYCLGYPDGGIQRYLKNLTIDISKLIQGLNPQSIYVHCIEGGHIDHDMTSFVVKSICNKINYSNVFEWTEYNPVQQLGAHNVKFLSSSSNQFKEMNIDISEEERVIKRRMLAFHQSQDVEQFFLQGETIRQAITSNLEMELFEHCQLPEGKLMKILKPFYKSLTNLKKRNDYNSNEQYLID